MGRYFEEIRAVVERHGGLVEKFIGDAVMAVFGIPTAHEDDAVRAVRAVAEIRERLQALGEELAVSLSFRTGVNTGEVVAGEGETLVTGDAVNVAARFEQAAAAGEILIGAETYRLVRNAVTVEAVEPLELKGKAEPVPAYRLVAVDPLAPGSARHLDVPIVGRVREQSRLLDDFEDVVSGGSATCSRCSVRPAWASRGSCSSSSPTSPDEPKCGAAAASTTATTSRTGRSSRC